MNVNITFLGNSATLPSLLSVNRIKGETWFVFNGPFAEDDLPSEWGSFQRGKDDDSTNATLVFPNAGLSYTLG